MSNNKVIIKNIFSLSIANVLTRLLSALAGIILVRYFAINDYGSYQASYAYVAMFGVISDLGIGQLLVRDGAKSKDGFEELSNNALVLEFILSVVTFMIMIFCLSYTSYSKLTILFIIIISFGQLLIDSTFTPVLSSVFQAYDKLDINAYITICSSLFNALMIFVFAYFRLNVILFIMIFPLTSIIFLIVRIILARNFYKIKLVFNIYSIKYIIKESIPFGASSVAAYIYLQSGTFILSLTMLEAATGIFTAAFKLILIAYTIPQVIYTSFMKKMFSYENTNFKIYKKYFNYLFKILLPIGIFIAFNFSYFAKEIIILLYKTKYMDSVIVFKYLSVLVLLEFINYPPSSLLMFIGQQKVKSIIQCGIAILNIVLNLVFIKFFGIMGVVYAIIATDTIKNIAWYITAYRFGYKINWDGKYLLILLGIIFTWIIYSVFYTRINFIILGALGSLIFAFILLRFKYFDGELGNMVKRITKNKS